MNTAPIAKRGRKRLPGLPKAHLKATNHRNLDADSIAILAKIRQIMNERNISLAQLAVWTGYHPVSLYQQLLPERHGRGPLRITFIRDVARAFDVSTHDLIQP
jgi:hypothetical protein